MTRKPYGSGGSSTTTKPVPFHPKKSKKTKPKKGRTRKSTKKATKAKKLTAPKPFHEAAGAGTLAGSTADPSTTLPFASTAGSSGAGSSASFIPPPAAPSSTSPQR